MRLVRDGLWRDNPAFVQLLGLCPLLAVSSSIANGAALGVATIWVMVGSALIISALRHWIVDEIRLPIFVLVVATLTTAATMVMEAWAQPLYLSLALFLQIIVTNCAILGRLEGFALRSPVIPAMQDAVGRGIGFALVLLVLGAIRELLAERTLACGMEDLLGPVGANLCVQVHTGPRVILAASPAGAFMILGLLIAARNWLEDRRAHGRQPLADPAPLPERD